MISTAQNNIKITPKKKHIRNVSVHIQKTQGGGGGGGGVKNY
jgi:hypothetical protein